MRKANHFTTWGSGLVTLAVFVFTISACAADWIYDSTAGTITDGVWTFNATVASDNKMTVGTCTDTGYPDSVSLLDFSKPVKDSDENIYTIVKLDTQFSNNASQYQDAVAKTDGASRIGELILPVAGLTTIGNGAFGCCAALTNVVNFLPDTVTSIGSAAFVQNGNLKADLFLIGLDGTLAQNAFSACSKIKSVTFGPKFKGTGGGNKSAPFQGCSGLTNVVFSPESSGIVLANNAFNAGATYTQPLVLYGVTEIRRAVFGSVKVASITFDKVIRSINTETSNKSYPPFAGNSTLNEIHFLGAPPNTFDINFYLPNQKISVYIPYKYRQQWWPYADGYDPEMSDAEKEQLIKREGTTFSSTYATTPAKRPLLLADMPPGLIIVIQ